MANLSAVIVCSAPNDAHDADFAAGHLTRELQSIDGLSITPLPDYGDTASLERADVLLSYIARRSPSPEECDGVRRFLERGGRWFAIHTSNWVEDGCDLPEVLGSRFLTHPPYGPFAVAVSAPSDPLIQDISPFEVEDELYVIDHAPDIEVLLEARWAGVSGGRHFEDAPRPMMYRRRVGAGEVLYLALGHCNAEGAGGVARRLGSWQSPVFRELVRRGVRWAGRA